MPAGTSIRPCGSAACLDIASTGLSTTRLTSSQTPPKAAMSAAQKADPTITAQSLACLATGVTSRFTMTAPRVKASSGRVTRSGMMHSISEEPVCS